VTRNSLLLSGLKHYWRSHVAVALGTAIAVAVLAGALIVGDSVRASLKAMTLDRLGGVDYAMTGPRFVREDLARDVAALANKAQLPDTTAPALMMTGAIESGDDANRRRAAGTQIIGCDERLWVLFINGNVPAPEADGVVLSPRTAENLRAKVGDTVSLFIELPPTIPRDSLLGDREQMVTEVPLKVSAIADEGTSMARFGLNPSQQLPQNAFANLKYLQEQLGLAAMPVSRSNPVEKVARVNTIFFRDDRRVEKGAVRVGGIKVWSDDAAPDANVTATDLTKAVHDSTKLSDLSLRVVTHADRGYISLESEQMMLDNGASLGALRTAQNMGRRAFPVLVYLFNRVANKKQTEKHSMYGVIAGVDFKHLAPDEDRWEDIKFAPVDSRRTKEPIDVVLNEWLATDLDVKVGDLVEAAYHQVGDKGELPELNRTFKVAAIVPLKHPWDDRGLTPTVPGITDAETFREWRQPFPMKMEQITERDEEYWKQHRATPKIFVPLTTAQSLFRSRYGDATSVHIVAGEGETAEQLATTFDERFRADLQQLMTGMAVTPVKEQGLQAAQGTTDFAGLFLGFSFFLIAAAAILVALLFRLGVERRIREFGLLTALGWTPQMIRRHAIGEALLVVHAGALFGLPLAVGYAALMIYGLKTWWNAAVGTQFLFLSVEPVRLISGGIAAIVIAGLSVLLAIRSIRKISPRAMLGGVVEAERSTAASTKLSRWRGWEIPGVCALLAAVLVFASLSGFIPAKEAFAGISYTAVMFFLSGGLALAAGMTFFSAILRKPASARTRISMIGLCIRNAARNPRRSAMTAGLVAAATFLVAAVASGRRNPAVELPQRDSGNGGYLLVAESSTPILFDLNTPAGRTQLGLDGDKDRWSKLKFVPFRVQPGENASCLNLYQTSLPTILAIPDNLIRQFANEARFKFIGMSPAEGWNRLLEGMADGPVPVLGDVNTLQYSLHKGPGDRVPLDDAPTRHGRELYISGMFDGSVFQGVLLMAESKFLQLFPERAGFQYFLVEAPAVTNAGEARKEAAAISDLMESQLRDYGVDAEPVADRLANFLAVQNTYLSTFQTLGGLGLLLGVVGVSAVMLRNVFERRSEIALLRAVGWQNGRTSFTVLGENLLLVGWGLFIGIGSALLAMAPHLSSTGAQPPWQGLGLLAIGVLAAGGLTATFAMRDAVTAPIVASLRDE
jgi:ABC-type antimicrobial peptide transport system permease subunit